MAGGIPFLVQDLLEMKFDPGELALDLVGFGGQAGSSSIPSDVRRRMPGVDASQGYGLVCSTLHRVCVADPSLRPRRTRSWPHSTARTTCASPPRAASSLRATRSRSWTSTVDSSSPSAASARSGSRGPTSPRVSRSRVVAPADEEQATGGTRRRPRRRFPRRDSGSARVTLGDWTRRTSCTSSTAPRTSSFAEARTCE